MTGSPFLEGFGFGLAAGAGLQFVLTMLCIWLRNRSADRRIARLEAKAHEMRMRAARGGQ